MNSDGEYPMKKIKFKTVTFVVMLILLSLNSLILNSGSQDSNDDELVEYTLTEFSQVGKKVRFTTTPEGNIVNLKLPASAEIQEASLDITGLLPQPIYSYPVGDAPEFITGADLNKDNNMDILTVNRDDNTLSVLLNDGTGNFGSAMSYKVDELPNYIYVGNLNKDSSPDVACTSKDSNILTVFFNLGDGNLVKNKNYFTGDEPRTLIGGDFDGDDNLDLITVNNNDNSISVFFNNGDGTYKDQVKIDSEFSPVCGAAGDLDGDGDLDLIVGNTGDNITVGQKIYRSSLSIMMNKGDGTFKDRVDYISGKKPNEIIVVDFNNDDKLDLATTNEAENNISVYINNGKGEFETLVYYPITSTGYHSPNSLNYCDIDNDEDPDIIVTLPATDTISILFNAGDGTFNQYETYLVGYLPRVVFPADFDNDKNIDLATANREDDTVTVSFNDGYGGFGKYSEYGVHGWPRGLDSTDLDLDGDYDIVVANYDGALTLWWNNGDGTFSNRRDYKLGVETFSVHAEDFDKDKDMDLTVSIEFNFTVGFIFNNGDGTLDFANRNLYEIGGNPYALVTPDINNDTWPDIVASTTYQHALYYSLNKGNGKFQNFMKINMSDHLTFDLAASDIDLDNDIDIIATNLGQDDAPENTVSVIVNEGDGTFNNTFRDYIVGVGPIGVSVEDFDNDGSPDIATANRGTNTVTILFNNGDGTFKTLVEYPAGKSPYAIHAKDINKDGWIDLLVPNNVGNTVTVLINDGDGSFDDLNYEFLVGSGPTKIEVADINNDTCEDLIVVNLNTNTATVHLAIYYPTGVKIGIGKDSNVGILPDPVNYLKGKYKPNKLVITELLNNYLKDAREQGKEGEIDVPIEISSSNIGTVELSHLEIKYISEPKEDDINGDVDPDDESEDQDYNAIIYGVVLIIIVLIILAIAINVKRGKK
jgi:hypothetical protein